MSTKCLLKFLLFFAAGTFNLIPMYGQGKFSRLYEEGTGTACILYDHPYIHTAAQISDSIGYRGIAFLKVDTTGQLLQSSNFFIDSLNLYPGFQNSFIKTGANEYLLVGNALPEALILKTDSSFQILDTVFFTFNGHPTAATSIAKAFNGDLLITGVVFMEDSAIQRTRKGFLLARFDPQLNLKWIKRFHAPSVNGNYVEQQAQKIIEDSRGNIWMAGYRQMAEYNSEDNLVIATDSLGNKIFEQVYGNPSLDEGMATIIETPDSNYLIVGGLGISPVTIGGEEYSYIKLRVLKISLNGSVLWDKSYGPAKVGRYPVHINPGGDGYIIGGPYYNWPFIDNRRNGTFRSYAMNINSDGDSIWYREYVKGIRNSDYNIFYDMAATPDGGFVAGGHFQSNNSPLTGQAGSHVWIVKADSMGCYNPACAFVSAPEEILAEGRFIYPNPASDNLKLHWEESDPLDIVIYNSAGQEVMHRRAIYAEEDISVGHLPAGLYSIMIKQKGELVGVEKVVIER